MMNPTPIHSAITIVQARMGSSRLPGKMMEDLAGKPLIWHILQRAKQIKADGPVVLATTDQTQDSIIAEQASALGVCVVRGSEDDVLGRFLLALENYPARWIARVCGDSPLFDPAFLSHCLSVAEQTNADVVKFDDERPTLFQGGEVVSAHALRFSRQQAPNDPLSFEHVTAWAMSQAHQWPDDLIATLINPDPLLVKEIKLSVDTPEDLSRLRRLYDDLFDGENIITLHEAAQWLEKSGW